MKDLLRSLWYYCCRYILIVLPDKHFLRITSYITFKRLGFKPYKYNLVNPKSFNEKLSWLKLQKANLDNWVYADKIEVRKYVAKIIGEQYLVPLIGVYDNSNNIDFSTLPDQFALKTNHGSGWNIICKNKSELDVPSSIKKLNRWLSFNAFFLSREYQYKMIKPAILCEVMLRYNIFDYKFFCFDGNPEIVQIDVDRYTNHKRAFYNMDWEKQNFSIRYKISERILEKPKQFEEMKTICRKLAAPFKFVRVDLYLHDNHLFFGELTLYPGGGNEPFNPVEYDFEFGKFLNL